jgi:subtilisin family serine protease
MNMQPAWSSQFAPERIRPLAGIPGLSEITPEWAWGGSDGAGVKVAIVDSGIDNDHPAIAGRVRGFVAFSEGPDGTVQADELPHGDSFGHGTACADIVRRLAPECELYSVKVLGARLSGKGAVFAAGLRWAIEQGMQVINLSLGTTKPEFFAVFHELADAAYFKRAVLVTAANNMPVTSFPSLYAAVVSVASHAGQDPYVFYYNPAPPVEFGAPGINVTVAWRDGGQMTVTGNSFAAPHMTGLVARILAKRPGLTPFEVKTILRASAENVRAGDPPPPC